MSEDFYVKTIKKAGIEPGDSVLAVCAGQYDRQCLIDAGISNAIISNLAPHAGSTDYEPFDWLRIDAERMDLADNSYDWVIVHAGLHHCGSPHQAFCEMLRVARKGVAVVESRDNTLMRLGIMAGATPDYELEAVAVSGGVGGGCRNTGIPNFIYRWTEREVEKTARSIVPALQLKFDYLYEYRLPIKRLKMSKNPMKRAAVYAFLPFFGIAKVLFPRQGNLFAFIVNLDVPPHEWLKETPEGLKSDMDYIYSKFDPKKFEPTTKNQRD